ncbi:MAG: PP2C family protein-serine/threonine phosphatase [Bryobacteraceae bacterium]
MKTADSKMNMTGGAPARLSFSWRDAFGKLEIVTLALLVLVPILSALMPESILVPIASMALFVAGTWTAFRWIRRLVRHAIWRLRNRLLLSYVFIAVVPILLLAILGLFGAWALSGQVAVYLVTQEFQQDLDSLHASASAMLRAMEDSTGPQPGRLLGFLSTRFPGIEILLHNGKTEVLRSPESSKLQHPVDETVEVSSAVLKDGLLFSGVHLHGNGRQVTFLLPIRKSYLQSLIPNLGEITLVDLVSDASSGRVRMDLHQQRIETAAAEFLSARAIAPAVNMFDYQVLWGMPIGVYVWDQPKQERKALLGVHTRISQVFRVIFSQKADWDQPWLIYLFYLLAISFLLVELIALCIGISITRTVTRAVHYLYESTERVQAGDFTYRIPVKGNDQLANLGQSYNMMIENLDRLLKVAKEKERLQADLDIAKEVQEQLYPRSVPLVEGLQITALLNPAKSVSGDFYDYQKIDARYCAIALGDVAGKGISAALLMANIQSAMRAQLRFVQERQSEVCTSAIVSQINKHLAANTTTEKYATFFFSVYDESTGELVSTNAGHLPPILLRGAEVRRLDVNGMVVGIFPHAQYDSSRITLEKGDLLLLYTDGITEPENEYDEMFGEERLIETVQRVAAKSNQEILREVFDAVNQWTFAPETADDMTMMIIRRV